LDIDWLQLQNQINLIQVKPYVKLNLSQIQLDFMNIYPNSSIPLIVSYFRNQFV